MKCLSPEEITEFLKGSLSDEDSDALEAHLDDCPVCLRLMAAVARLDGQPPASSTRPVQQPGAGRAEASLQDGTAHPRQIMGLPGRRQDKERWWRVRSDEAATEGSGRYQVRGEHARGGQARILVAYDTLIDRDVALKELLAPLQQKGAGDSEKTIADRSALADRFLREARITGQLDHPAIVHVYDVGRRSDGTPFYIMPIVRGRALAAALIECGNLNHRMKLLGHFVDMCHGVAYAHSRGVLHRDIKPHNVMIGQFGETVLVDWGLAKVRGLDEQTVEEEGRSLSVWSEAAGAQTAAGSSVGTPAYMSPEQAAGRLDDVDERSDIWALGAVLYEILTGRPPFHGRTASEIVDKACKKPVPPVANRCPKAPVELAAVAEKALHRDKDSRYKDAGELAEEVSAYMTGHRVRAYEYSSWELARLFASRNKTVIAATGLVLSVIIASLVLVSVSYHNESIAHKREQAARVKERKQRLVANYGLAQAYASRANRLFQEKKLLSARVFAARSLIYNPANPNGPWYSARFAKRFPYSADLSVHAASILWQTRFTPVTGLKRVLRTADAVQRAVFSPDGQLLASAGYDRSVTIWDSKTGKLLKTLRGHKDTVNDVVFSRSGRLLASAGYDKTVILWNLETGRPLKILRGHRNSVFGVALSPEGQLLASASYDKTVRMWTVRTGKLLKTLRGHKEPVFDVSFSPDGRLLASTSHDRTIRLWDVSTHASIATLKGHKDAVFSVSFSPDGKLLASASADKTVGVWDVGTAKQLASLEGHRDAVYGVAFSPDGKLIASASADRTVGVWDVAGARPLVALEGHRDAVYSVSFSPNGAFLASASFDKTVRMWNMVKAKSALTLEGHRKPVHGLTFSPDGRFLASASFDKTVRIWDISRARLALTFEGHGVRVHDLAFSPDGRWLVSAGRDGIARVWDLIEAELVQRFARHNGTVFAVAFSPDGRWVASAGRDGTVMVWSPVTGQSFLTLRGHDNMVFDVSFSPDGRLLASASKDRTVVVWDAATGKALQRLRGHRDWASGVSFSPDGKRLASAGKDGVVILWEVDTGRRLNTLRGHRQWVNRVRYSRSGELLVTAGDDRTAMIWSAATGRPLLVISANSVMDSVDVDISPDAKTVAVPDGNRIRLYPLDFSVLHTDPRTLLEAAERAAGIKFDAAVLKSVHHGVKQYIDVYR